MPGCPKIRGIKIFILFSLLIQFSTAGSSDVGKAPAAWTFSAYLKNFLDQDENYQQAKIDKKLSEAEGMSSFDYFQNTLSLQPTYLKNISGISGTGHTLEQSRKSINGRMTQLLPTGSVLTLDGEKFLDEADPTFGGLDFSYRLSFEQSLWRNSFGYGTRSLKRSAEASIEKSVLNESKVLMSSCIEAAEVYLSAYLGQEKNSLSQQVLKDSKKSLSIAQRGYKRRFLRKIDFLAARADFIKVKADALNAKMEYDKALNSLHTRLAYFEETIVPKLSEPSPFFRGIQAPRGFEKEKIVALLESQANMETSRQKYKSVKSENRSQVNFGVSVGHSERTGANALGGGLSFNKTESDSVELYLKLELPLFNRSQAGAVDSSFYRWRRSEVENRRLEKDLRAQFSQLQFEQEKLGQEIKLSVENEGIKKSQLKEAQRLLRSGKIEFTDYVRYRDSFFLEKQNALDIKSRLWQSKTKLAQFGDTLGEYCKGVL